VEFHSFPVESWTIILGNDSKEDVLKIGIDQLRLREGNKLRFHDALYAHGMRCYLVSFVSLMRLGLSFDFQTNGLDIFYNGCLAMQH